MANAEEPNPESLTTASEASASAVNPQKQVEPAPHAVISQEQAQRAASRCHPAGASAASRLTLSSRSRERSERLWDLAQTRDKPPAFLRGRRPSLGRPIE